MPCDRRNRFDTELEWRRLKIYSDGCSLRKVNLLRGKGCLEQRPHTLTCASHTFAKLFRIRDSHLIQTEVVLGVEAKTRGSFDEPCSGR